MIDYTLIDNIRETRNNISKEHDNDTGKLVNHYKQLEQQTKREFFTKKAAQEKRQSLAVSCRLSKPI